MTAYPAEYEYLVVVNDEGHFSIWDASRTLPTGWRAVGYRGSRQDCCAHIDEVWTDMRLRPTTEKSTDSAG